MHIKDFVYAKRIFQNSFFTNRFAFLVARDFLNQYPDLTAVSLVGYGLYSQLLINRIEQLLTRRINSNDTQVNHEIVSDSEDPHFLKNEPLHKNVLVVVPINTTFSTTFKIENLILGEKKIVVDNNLLPSVNLILVTHGDFSNREHVKLLNAQLANDYQGEQQSPYRTLNWKRIDVARQEITVRANLPKHTERKQKYLLAVSSELYLPEECPLCFPALSTGEYPVKGIPVEKLLLQTDKASVTPDLLLEVPRSFQVNPKDVDNRLFLEQDALLSGHICYAGNHFEHYVRSEPFFSKNQLLLEAWAKDKKAHLLNARPDLLAASVLLLCAGNRNNTYFADFINRFIFDDSAVLVHYDIAAQGTDNFVKFFSPHVTQATYIFYVDDIIGGGDTFLFMNDLVRYCNQLQVPLNEDYYKKQMDGVFTLVSKADHYTKSTIIANLRDTFRDANPEVPGELQYNVFYYFNLNRISASSCPMCEMRSRYIRLAQDATLDSVKHYFYGKALGLDVQDITDQLGSALANAAQSWRKYNPLICQYDILPWKLDCPDEARSLYQTYFTDGLYEKSYLEAFVQHRVAHELSNNKEALFNAEIDLAGSPEKKLEIVQYFISKLEQSVKSIPPFEAIYLKKDESLTSLYDELIVDLILKVLTTQPFNNIKPIKEKVFCYLVVKINSVFEQNSFHRTAKSPNGLHFDQFRKFKFLLRRISVVGSNFLFYPDTFVQIRLIFEDFEKYVKRLAPKRKYLIEELASPYYKTKSDPVKLMRGYLEQAIRNLHYIENSVKEFGYFFIAVLKESLENNDARSLILERTIQRMLADETDNSVKNFYFFLRLLKYENVSLLKKGANLIYEKFQVELLEKFRFEKEGRIDFATLKERFDKILLVAFDDYRLSTLKKYLQISRYQEWNRLDNPAYLKFVQFLYLHILLDNELEAPISTGNLEIKTSSILQNFFHLATESKLVQSTNPRKGGKKGFEINYKKDLRQGAFLVLKYQDDEQELIAPEKLMIAKATGTEKNVDRNHIIHSSVDNDSLSYLMINGINNKKHHLSYEQLKKNGILANHKKPWIIWELEKDVATQNWRALRGNVYSIQEGIQKQSALLNSRDALGRVSIPNQFTESLYLPSDVNKLKFMRLSVVGIESGQIFNNGKGVIGIFSSTTGKESASSLEDIEQLKLSLVLLPKITDFMNRHYDSSILDALVSANLKIATRSRNTHGHGKLLVELSELAGARRKTNSNRKKANEDKMYGYKSATIAQIVHSILLSGSNLQDSIDAYTQLFRVDLLSDELTEIEQSLDLRNMSMRELTQDMAWRGKLILENKVEGDDPAPNKDLAIDNLVNDHDLMVIPYQLFEVLFTEGMVNAKRHSPKEKKIIRIKLYRQDDLLLVEISNNSVERLPQAMLKLNKLNRYNVHGMGLIDMICYPSMNFFPKKELIAPENGLGEYMFKITFPIAKKYVKRSKD